MKKSLSVLIVILIFVSMLTGNTYSYFSNSSKAETIVLSTTGEKNIVGIVMEADSNTFYEKEPVVIDVLFADEIQKEGLLDYEIQTFITGSTGEVVARAASPITDNDFSKVGNSTTSSAITIEDMEGMDPGIYSVVFMGADYDGWTIYMGKIEIEVKPMPAAADVQAVDSAEDSTLEVIQGEVEEEPSVEEPVTDEIPATETPVEEPAGEETPVEETAEEDPVTDETPEAEAPVEEPAGEEASVEEPAGEDTVTEEIPATETPVEEPAGEEAPVEKLAGEEPVTDETPEAETPAEEPVVDEAPAEENAVTEETPATEPPVQETVEEAPPPVEEPISEETVPDDTPETETQAEELSGYEESVDEPQRILRLEVDNG